MTETLATWEGKTQTLTLRRLGANRYGFVLAMFGATVGKGPLNASSPREAFAQVRTQVLDSARAAERMDRTFLSEELTPNLAKPLVGEEGSYV